MSESHETVAFFLSSRGPWRYRVDFRGWGTATWRSSGMFRTREAAIWQATRLHGKDGFEVRVVDTETDA